MFPMTVSYNGFRSQSNNRVSKSITTCPESNEENEMLQNSDARGFLLSRGVNNHCDFILLLTPFAV